jgi:hypothetical protein
MPRLVVPEHPGRGHLAAQSIDDIPSDKYKDRLVKYIPAESMALYALSDKMVTSYYGIDMAGLTTTHPADAVLTVCSWGLLILGVLGTPIYVYRQRLLNQPWKLHAGLSTVAFVLWAYTLGGSVFILHHWYHSLLAALLAPIFTFVAAWFEPRSN